jgi:serine/threonine-protein kinase HipA
MTLSAALLSSPELLADDQRLALIRSLPLRPMLLGEDRIRLSLAGAQTKLPIVLVDGRVAKPDSGQPTTHILKPAVPAYHSIVENEAFCMMLAGAVKLNAAEAQPRVLQVPGEPRLAYLLVGRLDRTVSGGHVVRLHQEDFCQALGLGSPGFRSCSRWCRSRHTSRFRSPHGTRRKLSSDIHAAPARAHRLTQ